MTVFTEDAQVGQSIPIAGGQRFAGPDLTILAPQQWAAARDAIAGSVADNQFQRV